MKATDVAKYIIALSDNCGDLITNKKLQKLLYYVKAWGLVYFKKNSGVIEDSFEAWVHGPVCPTLYAEYKDFGYNPLKIDYEGLSSSEYIEKFKEKFGNSDLHKDMIDLIGVVFDKYAPLTSLQLELLSHTEQPWLEAREGLEPIEQGHKIINEETMYKFYSAKING